METSFVPNDALEVCQSWPAPKLVPVPGQKSVECVEAVTSERTGGGVLERRVFQLKSLTNPKILVHVQFVSF